MTPHRKANGERKSWEDYVQDIVEARKTHIPKTDEEKNEHMRSIYNQPIKFIPWDDGPVTYVEMVEAPEDGTDW